MTRRAQQGKNRGGYLFARADAKDEDLFGRMGMKDEKRILNTELRFNDGGTGGDFGLSTQTIPPDWIYDEHKVRLSFKLTVGEQSWTEEGPEIVCPAHEFRVTPASRSPSSRRPQAEYGNPSLKARSVQAVTG